MTTIGKTGAVIEGMSECPVGAREEKSRERERKREGREHKGRQISKGVKGKIRPESDQ